eukprot:SAG22_NODE_3690_length_1575_cov_2.197832_2_plen_202_part_00
MLSLRAAALAALCLGRAAGHGALVHPRSRNSIDAFVVPAADQHGYGFKGACANISGGACQNGQAAFWYSQGCFIGCPECDHASGRRQTDLCKKGFVGQLPSRAISVNGFYPNGTAVERDSVYDIYRHNPWRAPGHAPVADAWCVQVGVLAAAHRMIGLGFGSPPRPCQPLIPQSLGLFGWSAAASPAAPRGAAPRRRRAST